MSLWKWLPGEKAVWPDVPKGFVREPFTAFIPLCSIVLGIAMFVGMVIYPIWMKKMYKRSISLWERSVMTFFVTSVIIHFGLEQYYALHSAEIPKLDNHNIIARAWRYYAVSDTRWFGEQEGIPQSEYSCMKGLEYLAAYLCGPTIALSIILHFMNSPWAYIVQSVAVTAQAYGLIITWIPAYYEGLVSVPEADPVLYWGLFLGLQSPWFFIPLAIIIHSGIVVNRYFKAGAKKLHSK